MPSDWSNDIAICDLADEPELSEELNDLYNRLTERGVDSVPCVVLNLGGVSYLNSSNIAQILRIRRRLIESQKSMKLCSVADGVWSRCGTHQWRLRALTHVSDGARCCSATA